MNLSLLICLAILFVAGLSIGGQVNRGIYRLAWEQRAIGAWSPAHAAAPPRSSLDKLPLWGWWLMRREAAIHGRFFWVRPLLIELSLGLGLPALYWYQVHQAAIASYQGRFLRPPTLDLHAQFAAYCVLLILMMVATFIDFDEQTIPDAITVPGAVLGLLLAGLLPSSRFLAAVPAQVGFTREPLHLASGTAAPLVESWPGWLNGYPGLGLGVLAFLAWWLAVLPWTWTTRRGWWKAWEFFMASLRRRTKPLLMALALLGAAGTVICWWLGGFVWQSYFSALTGMVCGGGVVWAFRIVGTRALGQEAMGFGDVTLMAMIGAFTGWQATLMIFFLAPAAAVLISIAQWILTGSKVIAFGPYLCLATLFVLLRWDWLWVHYTSHIFSLGWFVPAMMVICVAMTWALLTLLRFVRRLTGGL